MSQPDPASVVEEPILWERFTLRKLPHVLVLAGLGLSLLLYFISHQALEQRQRNYFDFRVREAVSQIDNRMKAYQQVLRSVSGLFEGGRTVSREEFHNYLQHLNLGEHYPGIQGVGLALAITPQGLAAHTAAVRREGFKSYTVRPAGQRELYSSIVYIEPFDKRNQRAFGFDMYAEPVRRQAMDLAVDTDRMAMSGKVRLQQETDVNPQAGFLIYKAIYRNDPSADDAQLRRAQLTGWVYAPFRINDFLRGLLGEQAQDLQITVYDGPSRTPETLMYGSSSDETPMAGRFESVQTLRMMGHVWTLQIRANDSLLERVESQLPALLGSGAAVLSLMLGALVWVLVTGRERALQTAAAMNKTVLQERARLSAIIEGTRVGTWEWNVQTGETVFNEEWAQIIGYSLRELSPVSIQTWMKHAHPDDLKNSELQLQRHFAGEVDHYESEARMRHRLGHWVWVLDRGKVTSRTPDGQPLMMYGTHQDITQRKQLEETFRHGAQHDALTGLPNRVLLGDRLERALLAAQRSQGRLAVLYMDLDGFKAVNDEHGHEAGDVVLRTMARRIQGAIRASDTLARMGGDEFVVLLPEIGDMRKALGQAHKIIEAVSRKVKINAEVTVEISVSIGITLCPDHGSDAQTLMMRADQAMYAAKRSGKNTARAYNDMLPSDRTEPGALD